jgi:hypothetical protein
MGVKSKQKKEKINIMGNKYKVEKPISDTLKALSEALRSHEVALLTWVHKDYMSKDKFTEEEVFEFRKSLNDYTLGIPEAENILKRMDELDKQLEIDAAKAKEKTEKETKTEESQNKEEKEYGRALVF